MWVLFAKWEFLSVCSVFPGVISLRCSKSLNVLQLTAQSSFYDDLEVYLATNLSIFYFSSQILSVYKIGV
jgi:hypothetical protein